MQRARYLVMAMVALLAAAVGPSAAFASDFCDAVNAGALNQSTTYTAGSLTTTDARMTSALTTLNGVLTDASTHAARASWYNGGLKYNDNPGETITVTTTIVGTALESRLYRGATSASIGNLVTGSQMTASGSVTYTMTANEYALESRIVGTASSDGTVTVTAACVVAPPAITFISPTEGPTAGGTSVTLTGQNFTGSTLTVDGSTVTPSSLNDNQIVFTTPAHLAGAVIVAVTTAGGTASTGYTYVAPPTVTAVSPNAGPLGGGTTVIITGTNLLNATAVSFGGTPATGYTVNGATQITATAPAGVASTVDISVTTAGGTSAVNANDEYTYLPLPTVSSISPTAGPTGGGTTVVITGTGFLAAPPTGAVQFGAAYATYTINSDTQITATSPANAAAPYFVRVTNPGGTSATSAANEFTYVAAPTVTAVSPTSGSINGGQTVVITGTNLSGATNVVFGATSATGYVINSATQITATSPAGPAGTLNVRVTTVGGTSPTAVANQYTYVTPPVASSQTYGSIVAYNDGANLTTNIDVSLYLTGGDPATSYAVGSATTAQGGSVSVNSSGIVTYTPPVGYRNANDSFTYTATNAGGVSAPATVTVTIGNPTIMVTLPSATATVERVYNAGNSPVTFSGGRATYTVNSINGLPSGLTYVGGVISGTPAVNGTFTVTVNVTDSSLGAGPYNANTTATLTVGLPPAPVASSFTASAVAYNSGSATGTPISVAAHATESPTSYAVGSATTAGSGSVSIDAAGLVTYTPAVGFRGNDSFTFTASNAGGPSASATVTVPVNNPVFSVTLPASTGTVGVAYNSGASPVTISGGNAPYSNFSATGLPAGLTMDSSGVISGTPTTATTATVVVTVTDSSGGNGSYTSTASATLTIAAPTITLSPASGALPGAQESIPYSQTITATGGVAPITFSVSAGLPPGLTLSGATISGTPTTLGAYSFTVTGTDSSGNAYTGTANYSIGVGVPAPPTAGAVATTVAANSTGNTINPALSGVAATSIAVDTPPSHGTATVSGMTFTYDPTPGFSGTDTFTYTGNNSGGASTPATVTITVTPPTLAVAGTPGDGIVAAAYPAATFTATLGTAPYTFVGASLPPGLTVNLTTGVLSGTPTAAGSFTAVITATDAYGATGSANFPINVLAPLVTLTSPAAGALPTATAYVAYNQVFTATGGFAPPSFVVSAGSLPPGLTLSPEGQLSGLATTVGTYNFSVTPRDGSASPGPYPGAPVAYSITVVAPTLTLTPTSLSPVDYGVNFTRTFQASGGVAPYTYVANGALPTGVTFTSTASGGVLSGAPTEEGSFPLTITVTDSAGGSGPFTASVNVTLAVNAAPPPVVEPTSTTTPAGSATSIDVSSLIDGFYDSVIITTQPQHGTAVVGGGAARMRSQSSGPVTITYTPNPGYYGPDNFAYAATGPGGTSAPAAISVTVAPPAPVVVNDGPIALNANASVVIPVTANDTGPLDTIAIATAPTNGTATISGLNVTYTPTADFFGTDTFTYTATGPGGTSTPATVTLTVNPLAVPTQSAQTLTVVAGQSVILAATQGATGGPFTGVTVVTAPTKGTATVNGETIVYTPATGYQGPSDSFTYRIRNVFGDSAPIQVTVTVNPAPLTAPPITVEILAGQKAVVNLVAGASGGPFTGAAAVSTTPANAGASVVTSPSTGAYTLTFTPDNAFAGTAVVTYTLSNAFATSAPGRITVIVKARPDPSQDPEVKGLIAAQDAAAIRFADAQISNFNRRLEQLHNGGGAGRGFGVSVRGGDVERDDGLEARERFRKYASLGMNDAADPSEALLPAASAGYSDNDDGEDGQAGPKRWGVWAAGSADFGMRDAVGSQSGFRFTTDGLTGGIDYRVNPDFAFGLGVGYGRDSSRVGKSGTKSKAESYSAGLYASLKTGEKTFIDGVLGYGSLDFDTRRFVTSTGELVNGQRDGDQVFGALTFGMEHRTQTSLLSPYGRVAYSRSQLDAFSENGGGPYGLTYHAQTVKSLTGTLGLRGEFLRKTAAGLLAPRFRVEYSHDFEKANDALLNYTDWVGGPTYRLTVDPIDRDQLRLELGADLTIKNGIRFGLDFDNMVTKDSDSQGVRLTVQSPF